MTRKRFTVDPEELERLEREREEIIADVDDEEMGDFLLDLPEDIDSGDVWDTLRARILIHAADRMLHPEADLEPVRVDHFELDNNVGEGGMGIVFLAWDTRLDRTVALKLWKSKDPEIQSALQHEAKTLAQIKHPNVVTVHETGCYEGHVYFVMEHVEGVDGDSWARGDRAKEFPLTWLEAVRVYSAAGRGLAKVHDEGFMHNDFKPANILLGKDGQVKVADFGVAELILGSPDADEAEELRPGTRVYQAPERLAGKRGDPRSDQYSFFAALYFTLSGTRPYAGESREQLLASISAGELQDPKRPLPKIPRRLWTTVRKGLAREPDKRYQDMHEAVAELSSIPERLERRRWVGLSSLALTLAAVLLTGLLVIALRPTLPRGLQVPPIPEQPSTSLQIDEPATLEAVYGHIEDGDPEAAASAWLSWRNQERRENRPTAEGSLSVGQALFTEAKQRAERDELELAVSFAQHAEHVAVATLDDIEDDELSSADLERIEEGAADLKNAAKKFWRGLAHSRQSVVPSELDTPLSHQK